MCSAGSARGKYFRPKTGTWKGGKDEKIIHGCHISNGNVGRDVVLSDRPDKFPYKQPVIQIRTV